MPSVWCVGVGGVTGDLKTFFTDVVKAKASPKLRPRSNADRKLKVTSLTEQAMRHLGEHTRPHPLLCVIVYVYVV